MAIPTVYSTLKNALLNTQLSPQEQRIKNNLKNIVNEGKTISKVVMVASAVLASLSLLAAFYTPVLGIIGAIVFGFTAYGSKESNSILRNTGELLKDSQAELIQKLACVHSFAHNLLKNTWSTEAWLTPGLVAVLNINLNNNAPMHNQQFII